MMNYTINIDYCYVDKLNLLISIFSWHIFTDRNAYQATKYTVNLRQITDIENSIFKTVINSKKYLFYLVSQFNVINM